MSWIPMYSGIVNSSLWDEEDWVIKIFFTMLAEKGPGDIYSGSAYALGRSARKTEQEVMAAWEILSGPDKLRQEKQPHGGARIARVEGGWLIINAAYYRKQMSEELKRYRNAKAQKAWRERQAQLKQTKPLPLEGQFTKAVEAGEEKLADAIVTAGLPEYRPEAKVAAGFADQPDAEELAESQKLLAAEVTAAEEKAKREAARVKRPRGGKARPTTGGKAGSALSGMKNSAALQAQNAQKEAEAFRARMAAALAASQESVADSFPQVPIPADIGTEPSPPAIEAGETFPEV